MDHFGIGAGMQAAAAIYMHSARRTGRTTSLVESVKDGDRIVFSDPREAARVKRLCDERGVYVDCRVVDPKTPERVFEFGTPQGRTRFDHTWVEQRYTAAIARTMQEIDHLEREASGYGEAHRETARTAEEIAKWRQFSPARF
jgi:hypothetical protein